MKAWFPIHSHKNHVGEITDIFDEYVELRDTETGKYVIVKFNLITII
jgi:ferredoxin-fold anticodon binding domain-containing protein